LTLICYLVTLTNDVDVAMTVPPPPPTLPLQQQQQQRSDNTAHGTANKKLVCMVALYCRFVCAKMHFFQKFWKYTFMSVTFFYHQHFSAICWPICICTKFGTNVSLYVIYTEQHFFQKQ
jgi:hypothetical protein